MRRPVPVVGGDVEDVAELLHALQLDADDVRVLERTATEEASSYPVDVVTLDLRDGTRRRLVVKDLSGPRVSKPDARGRRERELHVYRDLLAGAGWGTARLLGTVEDHERGRVLLLLEHVPGTLLRYRPTEDWADALTWLARLQGSSSVMSGALGQPWLAHHDAAFFEARAEAATAAVAARSASLQVRLRHALRRYGACVEVMVGGPPTLVHGAYLPQNILVAPERDAGRICPLDWELAAVGHPLHDVATIVDGFVGDDLARLLAAYRSEAEGWGLVVSDDVAAVVDCFRLHRVLTWLAHSVARRYPHEQVQSLVEAVEQWPGR